jgi:threonine dehydrogenase-like Zn-dependent dehydrogenase
MKTVRMAHSTSIVVADVPEPVPRDGFVVVKVMASSIAGTERQYYDGSVADPWAGLRDNFGHQAAGVVWKAGSSRLVREGDRVTLFGGYRHCGKCRHCLSGRWIFCQDDAEPPQAAAFHSQYVLIRDDFCLPIPDAVDFDTASLLAAPFGAAYRAITRLRLSAQDRVLIMGQGALGLAATTICKFLGATVAAADTSAFRLECARRCGADVVADPADGEAMSPLLNGDGAHWADVAIECTGSDEGRFNSLVSVGPGGRVAFVGLGGGLHLDPMQARQVFLKEIELLGNWYVDPSQVAEIAQLACRGLQPSRIITHRFGIDDAPEAFATSFGGSAVTVVLHPWGG